MIGRCEDPRAPHFEYWGGRGIRVCERWRGSFANFLADVGLRPGSRHSLDRIDVNGHYEPGNVRWATAAEQQHNRRDNIVVEAFGQKRTAIDWSAESGIRLDTIVARLKRGWPPERAVTEPPAPWRQHAPECALG